MDDPPVSKTRRSVYKRSRDHPPAMVLTPRDEAILHVVASYRLMTREQIQALLFAPTLVSIARLRLQKLFHNGYLDRIRLPLSRETIASRPVYKLGPKGWEFLAAERGEKLARKREKEIGEMFIAHHLAVNDFRVAVSLAAKACDYTVMEWVDDAQLKSQAMWDYVLIRRENKTEKVAVIPDAYFALRVPGKGTAHFFLELDRGTEDNAHRWKRKVLAYQAYIRSGQFEERYHSRGLRVLTVSAAATGQRAENLKKTTEEAGGNDLFWFTTSREITPETVFTAPIWSVAQKENKLPLIL